MSTYPHHKHENDQVSGSYRKEDINNKELTVKSREVDIWNVHKILLIDFLILIHNSSFDIDTDS